MANFCNSLFSPITARIRFHQRLTGARPSALALPPSPPPSANFCGSNSVARLSLSRRSTVRRQCTARVLGRARLYRRLISAAYQKGPQDKRGSGAKMKETENETGAMVTGSKNCSRFRWSKERTRFLTSYLVKQASDAKGKDTMFREDALVEAARAVSRGFQRECSVADVKRRLTTIREKWRRIQKMKALRSATWDEATRTIIMREDDYQQYAMDHPKDSWLLNRPIEDYDDLCFMFSDDLSADGILARQDQKGHSFSNQISVDPMDQKIANEDIRYLVLKIGELTDAVKSLKPRDFADDLWRAVTACGYNERMSITAFEYFLKNEVEGKIFLVRGPDLRKEWLTKFFSSLL
ncbi:hypothetical protein ACP70R_038786 [Stipagrostis hirtigluma subsp. patula]